MNNDIEKIKAATAQLDCGDEKGTAFLIGEDIAITMSHCLIEALMQTENTEIMLTFKNIPGEVDLKVNASMQESGSSSNPISILKLEHKVQAEYLKLAYCETPLPRDTELLTYGYPAAKGGDGYPVNLTVNDQCGRTKPYDYDVSLFPSPKSRLNDYSGMSGSPVMWENCVVGILATETVEAQNGGKNVVDIQAISNRQLLEVFKEFDIDVEKMKETDQPEWLESMNEEGDSVKSPLIKANYSLHIDSILDTNINKKIFREEDLKNIRHRIEINQSSVLFLSGRPGIGKTTLARLYANTCEKTHIYFVKYRGSFEETLNSLSKKKREDSWKKILKYWKNLNESQRKQTLLIIDNFNDDSVEGVENSYYRALHTGLFEELRESRIQLLITTRINMENNVYPVEGVKDPVALFEAYYKQELNDQQKKGVAELAELLHNNTLLLVLCAGLMREECSLAELINEAKKCNMKIHEIFLEKEADFESKEIRERFTLYEQAKAILNLGEVLNSEENRYILANMALLPLKGMQRKEFLQFIHKEGAVGINLIKGLILRSWIIEEEEHIVCLHPLIREILLDTGLVVWDRCRNYCISLSEKLDLQYEFQDRERYKNYAEEVYTIFSDAHDLVLAKLFYNFSDIYDQIGAHQKSRELIDNVSLYLNEIKESKRKVRLCSGMAYSYNNCVNTVEDLEYAVSLLDQAQNMLERIRSQCTEWEYYSELGRIYSNRGSNELARIPLEKSEDQRKKHADFALKFHQQALEQRNKALEIAFDEAKKAASERDKATSYVGIATAYYELELYEESVQIFRESLQIRRDYDIGRVPISQWGMLRSTIYWYNKNRNCDLVTIREVLDFYPELLNRNIEQENENAFQDNKMFFETLCQIIDKDDDFTELRALVKEKKQKVGSLKF